MSECIGVHSGIFHLDDVLCVVLLKYLPQFKDAKIVRSNDIALLESQCTIICDIGWVYNHEKRRYDHHQKGFNEKFAESFKVIHSACGLIYRHYGMQVITEIAKKHNFTVLEQEPSEPIKMESGSFTVPPIAPSGLKNCYKNIYLSFILSIDGKDNGIPNVPDGTEVNYANHTFLGDRITRLNPQWNEDISDELSMSRFLKATEIVSQEFEDTVVNEFSVNYAASFLFMNSFNDRYNFHPSGMAIYTYAKFQNALFDLEKKYKANGHELSPKIYYSVGFDPLRKNYSIKAISEGPNSMTSRLPFPQSWRGLTDEKLQNVTGVKSAQFCHVTGFLVSCTTLEDAKILIDLSLQQLRKSKKEPTPEPNVTEN